MDQKEVGLQEWNPMHKCLARHACVRMRDLQRIMQYFNGGMADASREDGVEQQ